MTRKPDRTMLGALALVVAVLAGCSPHGDAAGPEGSPPEGDQPPAAGPAEITVDNGFYTAGTLPAPLGSAELEGPAQGDGSLSARARFDVLTIARDDDAVRLVGAFLQPEEGPALGSDRLSGTWAATQYDPAPWIRLVDETAGTVIEPFDRGAEGAAGQPDISDVASFDAQRKSRCVCSVTRTASSDDPEPPSTVELLLIDFPAPEGDAVSVLPGPTGVMIPDITVAEERDGWDLRSEVADFGGPLTGELDVPEDFGAGASVGRVLPISRQTAGFGGISSSDSGDEREINVPADVLFDLDEDSLDAEAEDTLADAADILASDAAGATVTVTGHTDDQGDADYNQALSERRAEAVSEAITPLIADADITLETRGAGETEPLKPNQDANGAALEDNRADNRRVAFSYPEPRSSGTAARADIAGIPEMESTATADGAETSAILDYASRTGDMRIRIDVRSLTTVGAFARLEYAFALPDDASGDGTFLAGRALDGGPFGDNGYGLRGTPTSANTALVDPTSGTADLPLNAGGATCLCTESAISEYDLRVAPTTMVAYYPTAEFSGSELALVIDDVGIMRWTPEGLG